MKHHILSCLLLSLACNDSTASLADSGVNASPDALDDAGDASDATLDTAYPPGFRNACAPPSEPAPSDPMSDEEWRLFELHEASLSCFERNIGLQVGHGGVVWQAPPLDCVESARSTVQDSRIEDRSLVIDLQTGGGCEQLRHNLHWDGTLESEGVRVVLTNTALSCPSMCTRLYDESIEFDVEPVLDAWAEAGNEGEPAFEFVDDFAR